MEDMEKDIETNIETDMDNPDDGAVTQESANSNAEAAEEAEMEISDDENSEAGNTDAPEENMSRADKKAAKRQAKADKKEDAYKEKIDQLEDRVKRQMAEFENFRKRSDREKQMMFETGAKSVLEKILPVVDNFERGLQTVPPENAEDPFVDGMNRVYKQLLTELDNMGVKPIEAVGCEFDPNLHNAVMQVESDEYETGVVAQELQKGYTYHDTVIRHSMVAVVQ
jgi:molecular chaperone GrpE